MSDEPATKRRRRIEQAAEEELQCFHAARRCDALDGAEHDDAHQRARAIQGCLDGLLTFHAGALALRFTPRRWSPILEAEYGEWSSLVVRMDCAAHPSDKQRRVEDCEADAALRLEAAIIGHRDRKERARLLHHAKQHLRAAVRAYLRVRRARDPISSACDRGPR